MTDNSLLSFLIDRYGFRLTTADLAKVLKTTPAEVRNQISAGTFPVRTAKTREGRSAPRYADVRDVAEYLDATRPTAASPGAPDRSACKSSAIANPHAPTSPPLRGSRSPTRTSVKSLRGAGHAGAVPQSSPISAHTAAEK